MPIKHRSMTRNDGMNKFQQRIRKEKREREESRYEEKKRRLTEQYIYNKHPLSSHKN